MLARPWTTLVDVPTLAAAIDAPDLVVPAGQQVEDGDEPQLVILDARHKLADPEWGRREYETAHVPRAQFAHVDRDLSAPPSASTGRHPLPDVDAFLAACSRWGIGEGVQVVAYDDLGGAWASRAWWLLRYYGHREVAVLDGGIQAWVAAALPLTADAPRPEPRRFAGRPGQMPTVTTWDLTTRAPRCLMDARAPERYRGEVEPIDPVAGHIPGAKSMPTSGNVDKDGRFLPREELRAKYEAALAGLAPKDAAFYCGSGVTATHDVLAMEVAGLPGAALYPGSWSEWIRNPMRPVRKGGEP